MNNVILMAKSARYWSEKVLESSRTNSDLQELEHDIEMLFMRADQLRKEFYRYKKEVASE